MTSIIELSPGTFRISVSDALFAVGRVAVLPPSVDVFVTTTVDEAGVEVVTADSKFHLYENKEGSSVPQEWLAMNFNLFCKATGTTPRNKFHPFIFDYDGGVVYPNGMYDISIEEFRQFAEAYGVAVTMGAPVKLNQQPQGGARKGRPRSVDTKALILGRLIEIMLHGTEYKASALPGCADDLLDACQRIEKNKTRKSSVFGGATSATFHTWLNSAGYGMKSGRTPAAEENYWTSILPKAMGKITDDIFPKYSEKKS